MSDVYFVAYPSTPPEIGQSLEAAEKKNSWQINLRTWRTAFGPGNFIDQNVLPEIIKARGLIFDISIPNNNVFFEAGYAIGRGKAILPVVNKSIKDSGRYLQQLGLFDNVTFLEYENGEELHELINNNKMPEPLFTDEKPINKKQPIYVLDALRRSEFAAKVISSVKAGLKFYRSFDPQEEYRMRLRDAYDAVSQSAGVLVTLLSNQKEDFELHNIRASFLSGLALGMGKECAILVDGTMETPLDFRDHCRTVKDPRDISDHVNAFGFKALSVLSAESIKKSMQPKSLIQKVCVGSAAAENEFRDLEEYFVDTAEFRSALNGQGRLVIGRKGSGKTAIFWRVRDTARSQGAGNIVIDLKPDGYQLRKFKEQLVKMLSTGTKEHTLTAFWEYLIFGELIKAIYDSDYRKYGRDPHITEKLDNLGAYHSKILEGREGDFSERMMGLLSQVEKRFKEKYGTDVEQHFLSTEDVTDLIYRADIKEIQKSTFDYLAIKDRTVVLIDNVDKAWGAYGVDEDDIIIVRTLMEALRKIERSANRQGNVKFDWLLFLRNDVYELLVEGQSDRGKENKIVVDWESKTVLREIIQKRIKSSAEENANFKDAQWNDIAKEIIEGKDGLDWLVDRCLMRPRYLIQLVSQCHGHAISSNHEKIEEEDYQEGYRSYSLDIIANTNFELQDIFPQANDAIYVLIGLHRNTTICDVKLALMENKYSESDVTEIIRLFFWFGVLGAKTEFGEEKYIYDYRYDEKIFSQIRQQNLEDDESIYINLAFAKGLDCRDLI